MGHQQPYRCGYVAVAGAPNVGKSTLVNRLVGSKLAIVSPKAQTTRSVIRGIRTADNAQIIYLDTPGLHRPQDKLGDYMVGTVRLALPEADIIYVIVEPAPPGSAVLDMLEYIRLAGKTTFLLINKVDLVRKESVLPLIARYSTMMNFSEIIPVSARCGDNIDRLIRLTIDSLPESPAYYPEDIVSDQIEREFIGEFIREKLYLNTRDEIPYSAAVVVDDMEERQGGGAYIRASIYVEKKSQKGIVIGSAGSMIKKIGAEARREIERFMGYAVFLDLQVKVLSRWRRDEKALEKLGYR